MWRDWTYVGDIADGIVRASERRLGYEIINLGRGEPGLLKEFVEKVAERTKRPVTWQNRPMPSADVHKTWATIDKARRLLGYQPQVSVDEGIEKLVDWYQRRYEASSPLA
jgi:UDP-glucuronate 4-epimerase